MLNSQVPRFRVVAKKRVGAWVQGCCFRTGGNKRETGELRQQFASGKP